MAGDMGIKHPDAFNIRVESYERIVKRASCRTLRLAGVVAVDALIRRYGRKIK